MYCLYVLGCFTYLKGLSFTEACQMCHASGLEKSGRGPQTVSCRSIGAAFFCWTVKRVVGRWPFRKLNGEAWKWYMMLICMMIYIYMFYVYTYLLKQMIIQLLQIHMLPKVWNPIWPLGPISRFQGRCHIENKQLSWIKECKQQWLPQPNIIFSTQYVNPHKSKGNTMGWVRCWKTNIFQSCQSTWTFGSKINGDFWPFNLQPVITCSTSVSSSSLKLYECRFFILEMFSW